MSTPIMHIHKNFQQICSQIGYLKRHRFILFAQENDGTVTDVLDNMVHLATDGKSIAATYIEAIKHDRREKRKRYRRNKAEKKNFELNMKKIEDRWQHVNIE